MPQVSRIELYLVSQRVQVHGDGKLLASLNQAPEFIKQAYLLEPRHCLQNEDVRMDLLTTSESTTLCTFKGIMCISS